MTDTTIGGSKMEFMVRRPLLVALSLFAMMAGVSPMTADANVSLKNGNFFVGYTDLVYPGGFEPKIDRIYNTKTAYKGIFGWNWGSEYEAYLTVSADGSVVVHEFGGGAENRFNPAQFNEAELNKAVEKLAEVAKSGGAMGSAEQLNGYKKKIKGDAAFRNDEWEKFRARGLIQPRQLAVGTKLYSNRFSFQLVTRVQGGYVRSYDNGRLEKFDDVGRLVRVSDKNNNFIDLAFGKDGKLQKIVDNFNRKMFFTWNAQGLVEKIQGESGKEANYRYNELGELVYSKDAKANVFNFKYSSDKRHFMTEIGYSDKTTMKMAYYPKSELDSIRSVTDRDGSVTEYKYEKDSADKGHTAVSVAVKGKDGKAISSSRYDYYVKHKADGEEWTFRLASSVDGERTETTYNECCGLPILIKKGDEETAFQYDNKGHVTKKVTPAEITELSYDPQAGKVSRVVRHSKLNKQDVSWSEFKYDDKGNLKLAKNSDNKGVQLFYDNNGRIKSLVDQNRRRIDFKYNENSKPVEITDPALGSITVSYTNAGEIKKVESTAGRKIALQVTSAFQNLLDIIRPAGVSLSF